jgi:hypothetical protein
VNKKKQKNFDPLFVGYSGIVSFIPAGFAVRAAGRETSMDQSFFGSFCSQKEQFFPPPFA